MKNSISFLFFTLLAWATSAQVNATLFASLPNDINYICIKGNELYVAESVFFSGNITKLDLTQPNPAPVMVLPDIGVTSMDFIGNHLYYNPGDQLPNYRAKWNRCAQRTSREPPTY